MKLLALASAFVLVGAGCAGLSRPEAESPAPAEETQDASGVTLSEQADIVVDAAFEEDASEEESVDGDASLFMSDEQELNDFESSYDENEL